MSDKRMPTKKLNMPQLAAAIMCNPIGVEFNFSQCEDGSDYWGATQFPTFDGVVLLVGYYGSSPSITLDACSPDVYTNLLNALTDLFDEEYLWAFDALTEQFGQKQIVDTGDRYYEICNVHKSVIRAGDTILYNGVEQTVCPKDISHCSFMGISIFGNNFRSGTLPVKRITYKLRPKIMATQEEYKAALDKFRATVTEYVRRRERDKPIIDIAFKILDKMGELTEKEGALYRKAYSWLKGLNGSSTLELRRICDDLGYGYWDHTGNLDTVNAINLLDTCSTYNKHPEQFEENSWLDKK